MNPCREAHADRSGTSSVRMPAVPLEWNKATLAASPPGPAQRGDDNLNLLLAVHFEHQSTTLARTEETRKAR